MNLFMFKPLKNGIFPFPPIDGSPQTLEGPHEVGWRPFMPASTLSRRSIALLRVNLGTGLRKADQFPTEIAQEPFIVCFRVNFSEVR